MSSFNWKNASAACRVVTWMALLEIFLAFFWGGFSFCAYSEASGCVVWPRGNTLWDLQPSNSNMMKWQIEQRFSAPVIRPGEVSLPACVSLMNNHRNPTNAHLPTLTCFKRGRLSSLMPHTFLGFKHLHKVVNTITTIRDSRLFLSSAVVCEKWFKKRKEVYHWNESLRFY